MVNRDSEDLIRALEAWKNLADPRHRKHLLSLNLVFEQVIANMHPPLLATALEGVHILMEEVGRLPEEVLPSEHKETLIFYFTCKLQRGWAEIRFAAVIARNPELAQTAAELMESRLSKEERVQLKIG